MKTIAAAIALLTEGVLALTWQTAVGDQREPSRLSRGICDLQSNPADRSKEEIFHLQRDCADQAAKLFHAAGYVENGISAQGTIASYENHYNAEMNICFILIQSSTSSSGLDMWLTSAMLVDVIERREYAELNVSHFPGGVQYLSTCELMPRYGDRQECKSVAEFRSFVTHYMERAPGPGPFGPL
jgi:hypothetical protein